MNNDNDQLNTLTQLNEELENYFSNTIIPQIFVDANLVLRKYTPPAMRQFNLKEDSLGKHMNEISENFRFPTIIENIQAVIRTGQILEKEIQTIDSRWYQMNIIPYLIRKENRTNGVIITFVDITPRIKDLKEQERLNHEHELLLDTIAHDIKNPLLALGLTVEMLRKVPENGGERYLTLVGNVESSVKELKKVIDDLTRTRFQQHRYQPEEELLDLENIVEDVRLVLAQQIQASGASIETDIEISQIMFARRKLRSVLYNLVNNALNYAHPDRQPEIRISSYQHGDEIVIRVADNGVGISQTDQDIIFEKFNRLSPVGEGSGVGLYLVNSIVTAANGRVKVDSEHGKGAAFSVFLKNVRSGTGG
ncbi:sensor histidine kinase [Pedobacter deserti]|uniref:sensor histidine kinase n=1 Tax=Pedobacter deserti TaxID=2817382 RepID=UPI00210ED6F7|nr:ATP-binding protein [Pedobacter sp. SYSU D00382]